MDNYWFDESEISKDFIEPDTEANKEFLECEVRKREGVTDLIDDPAIEPYKDFLLELASEEKKFRKKIRKKEYRESIDALREDHCARHFRRFMQGYDNGVLNTRNEYYCNGWSSITGFVSKALGPTKYIVNTEKEELALELAQKLSDLFFEYRDRAVEMEGNDE